MASHDLRQQCGLRALCLHLSPPQAWSFNQQSLVYPMKVKTISTYHSDCFYLKPHKSLGNSPLIFIKIDGVKNFLFVNIGMPQLSVMHHIYSQDNWKEWERSVRTSEGDTEILSQWHLSMLSSHLRVLILSSIGVRSIKQGDRASTPIKPCHLLKWT